MKSRRGKFGTAVAAVAATAFVAGGVYAAGGPPDEAALEPARPAASKDVEQRVDALLAKMTTEEKLQQVQLLSDGQMNEENGARGNREAKAGVGGVFSLVDPKRINELQHIAMEQSRLKIPILFAYDTIHGYRTIFPIPLATGSSFDPEVAANDHRIGARESAAVGLKQIYSPMVDVSHEPRWGRISEAAGEDPYLNSVMAAARVKAAQGRDYSAKDKVVTSVKHYAAYGQPEGGRDYGTTDMSENRLRNYYLPPFKAAIDAGADTAMCSFNAINGVPGCANKRLETDILKNEWNWDGFIESDYTAVAELLNHGTAADPADAGAKALMAGTDSEMVSTFIRDNGKQLLADGKISMARLDDAVRRILRIKFRAGLFDNPYVDPSKAEAAQEQPDALAAARRAGGRSMVLLENQGKVLPLDPTKKTAVIGPLADNGKDQVGPWWGRGDDSKKVTVLQGIREQSPGATYAEGCKLPGNEPPDYDESEDCPQTDFTEAVNVAKAADQVVLAVGETRAHSGEATSRSVIDLPGNQEKLIADIKATGKPFVVVLFNGRPLTLDGVTGVAPAILEAWFPGVQAGNSVADVVFGKVNPGGKLPVSFPRRVGQVPIYYNHENNGRPCDPGVKWNSRYRDIKSCDPQYVFGYGLSYSQFEVTNLRLSRTSVSPTGKLTASVDVQNVAGPKGDEVVQLYLSDPVASISQPVRRLRGFERVTLDPGQKKTVTFTIDRSDFGFYDNSGKFVVEPGRIDLYAGNSSKATMRQSFTVSG
ncbi:MAG TPA: beta-glucosidase BglX [Solirubrobacteraceae bacterium]|nr:beta-glucosidase BglX [Solirubrobacteraceae bacterium]